VDSEFPSHFGEFCTFIVVTYQRFTMLRIAQPACCFPPRQVAFGIGALLSLGVISVTAPALAGIRGPEEIYAPELSLTPPHWIAQTDGGLRRGDQGDAVVALQQALGRFGLFPASNVNGVYGPTTEQAVRTFQRIREMPVTGVADTPTLNALGVDLSQFGPALVHPDHGSLSRDQLSYGSSGPDVMRLQRALGSVGLGVGVDGLYGNETRQAVRTFQRVRGLPVTGNADRSTLNALGFQTAGGESASPDIVNPGNSYVAVIIGSNQELASLRRLYPDAALESTRHGTIITIGRFADRGNAENRAQNASQRGYDARVMHSREL
jgi:peptidoglycan hydrolase-like protein with peptidoglycan-binding domain